MSGRVPRRKMFRLLVEDARMLRQDVLVNSLVGSVLLPRMARYVLLRALGFPLRGIIMPGVTIVGPLRNLTMADGAAVGRRCYLDLTGPITIGARSAIGFRTTLATSAHPIDDAGRWSARAEPASITIGDDVWIATGVIVCPGAVIESNVVVAAGAVVSGRLEAGGVYGGVPARRLGATVISGSAP